MSFAVRLAALVLAPALFVSSTRALAPRTGPEPPPAFRGPDVAPTPLDRRIATDPAAMLKEGPQGWCPSGPDFERWLTQRLPGAHVDSRASLAKAGGPVVTWHDGVVLMEDDGTLLRRDRRPDLEGASLELTPSADGYTARVLPIAYESDVGSQVLFDEHGFAKTQLTLSLMSFPFGGVARTDVWVTSTFAAYFVDPSAPSPAQLQLADVIADRTPRVAPLQQGTSLGGWNAYFRQYADRTVLTWRATDGGGYDADVQEVLYADGRILMSWLKLRGVLHGSVVVVDGNDSWWNDRALGGSATSPPDEVTVPAPDGPAADYTEVRALQVGGSEILQIELQMQAPLPAATDGTIQYVVEIRDEPGGPVLSAIWFEWEDGHWNWTYAPAEVTPWGFRFNVNRSSLNLTDDTIEITAWSATSWSWQQAVVATVSWPQAPPIPLMRDFSAIGPELLRGPLAESFTIPELDVYAALNAYNDAFGSPRIDGLAVFQNVLTDIIFYAGAYSTVGNAGADGIGTGSSTDAQSPALLHMNALHYGWNSWDAGKVTVLNHEFGHHWLYYYSIDEGGTIGKPLGDGHPAGWAHCPAATPVYNAYDASCMGGSNWTDNADGTFTSTPTFASYGYSWHELYLMGLADRSEVTDWFYLKDSVPGLPGAYWPPDNSTVTASRVNVTRQQIVDAIGERNPAWPDTQRDFIVPMVLVARPGEWVQDDLDEVVRTCNTWKPQFHVATLDRGSVTCNRIGDRPPAVQIVDPPADVVVTEGATVSFTGVGTDPDLDDVTLTWDFAGAAPGANGPGPVDVTFTDPGDYLVTLSGVDATGRAADPPATVRVTVVCAPPAEMPILRIARTATTLEFRLDPGAPPADEHVVGATTTLPPTFAEVASGALPVSLPTSPEPLVFFRLAGRNLPDCLGSW